MHLQASSLPPWHFTFSLVPNESNQDSVENFHYDLALNTTEIDQQLFDLHLVPARTNAPPSAPADTAHSGAPPPHTDGGNNAKATGRAEAAATNSVDRAAGGAVGGNEEATDPLTESLLGSPPANIGGSAAGTALAVNVGQLVPILLDTFLLLVDRSADAGEHAKQLNSPLRAALGSPGREGYNGVVPTDMAGLHTAKTTLELLGSLLSVRADAVDHLLANPSLSRVVYRGLCRRYFGCVGVALWGACCRRAAAPEVTCCLSTCGVPQWNPHSRSFVHMFLWMMGIDRKDTAPVIVLVQCLAS